MQLKQQTDPSIKMKKLLAAIIVCALTLSVNAGQGKHKARQEERAALKKELLDKYDTNKDGKLDKEERAKMSKEDKQKARRAGLGKANKHADKNGK